MSDSSNDHIGDEEVKNKGIKKVSKHDLGNCHGVI